MQTTWSSPLDPSQLVPLGATHFETGLHNGTELFGADERLACAMGRVVGGGRAVTVAALGGSISAGATYTVRNYEHLYHTRVVAALNRVATAEQSSNGGGSSSRASSVVLHNGALPATGPSFFEHCLESQLPATADVVLVEFTVNLDHNPDAFERMLRKLLTLPGRPAIIVVSMHAWRIVDVTSGRRVSPWRCIFPPAEGGQRLSNNHTIVSRPEDQMWEDQDPRGDEDRVAAICRHYNVPLVSMRAGLLAAVRTGSTPLRSFMRDCRHPNDRGHAAMARAVVDRLLATRLGDATGSTCPPPPTALPPPLSPAGYPTPNSMCARGELLRQRVVHSHGFVFTAERRAKPGFVATVPGSNLTVALFDAQVQSATPAGDEEPAARVGGGRRGAWHGRAQRKEPLQRCQDHDEAQPGSRRSFCAQKQAWCHSRAVNKRCPVTCGLCSASSRAATAVASDASSSSVLWLAYLSSYQHMGRARVLCEGSCTCGPSEIDAHIGSERTSVTTVHRLIVSRRGEAGARTESSEGRCLLTLTVLPGSSSPGTEHKFKLIGLLLGQNRAGDLWLPPGAMRSQEGSNRLFFPGVDLPLPGKFE